MKKLLQSPLARGAAAALVLFLWDIAGRPALYSQFASVISGRIGALEVGLFYLAVFASTAALLTVLPSLRPRFRYPVLGVLFAWMAVVSYFRLSVGRSFLPDDLVRGLYLDDATWHSFAVGLSGDLVVRSLLAAVFGTAAVAWVVLRGRKKKAPVPPAWIPAAGLAAQVVLWSYAQLSFHLQRMPVEPVGNAVRCVVCAAREYLVFLSVPRERPIAQRAVPPTSNFLFIVDESVRADFLSPEITPYLHKEIVGKPGYRDYGPALAAATCSVEAKTILLTGAEEFPDKELRTLRNPTIWDLAKAAGYRTWLLDAQGTNFPSHAIRSSDLASIDRIVPNSQIPEARGAGVDIAAARWLHEELRRQHGIFAVLFKAGVHTPYGARYLRNNAPRPLRNPQLPPGQIRSNDTEAMRNSYANGVEYTVDYFFETLHPSDLPELTLVYTSDHAENLGENGARFGHCAKGLEQARVPLFLFTTAEGTAPPVPDRVHSHFELYPTWQEWFGVSAATASHFPPLDRDGVAQPALSYITGSLWIGTESIPVSPDALRTQRDAASLPETHP